MQLPPEITTFLISMVPVIDIRFGIPIGIGLGLTKSVAYFWGVTGNLLFTFAGMKLLDPITSFLSKRSKFFDKFFKNLFAVTRKHHEDNIEKYGPVFIMLFVAIPIPGSGALIGGLIGWLFGISFWRTFAYVTAGTLLAGCLILLGFGSIEALWHLLFY